MKFILRLLLLASATLAVARAQTLSITQPTSGTSVLVNNGGSLAVAGNYAGFAPSSITVSVTNPANVVSTVTATPSSGNWATTFTPTVVGTYTLRATALNGASTVSSPFVTVTVTGFAPAISLALTGGGSSVPAGSSRFLVATVTDDGAIDHVDFLFDGTVFASVSRGQGNQFAALFTAPMDSAQLGAHQITATAYDNDTNASTSTPIVITVSNPIGVAPTVGITGPVSGAFFATGTAVTVSGNAADTDGVLTQVQLFANGLLVSTATTSLANWSISWTPSVVGPASLVAIATDDKGNAVASPAVGVNVTDTTSPSITVAATPTVPGGTTLPVGATRNILASVTAATGRAIVRVEFFVNGTKVGEKTTTPYSYRFVAPVLATGELTHSYSVSARATDNTGLARDAQLTLNVVPAVGAAPSVNLLTPTNNLSVIPNTAVQLAASALATGGTVSSVQFYANGSPANINNSNALTAAPYVSSFTPTLPGSYAIDAIATDDRGNTAVSNAATINVAFGTPTITLTVPNPNATTRVTPNVPLTLAATAIGGTGASVLLVEFLLDGAQIGTASTPTSTTAGGPSYTFKWTPTAAQLGTHQITARVTDTNSQSATSAVATINVATITGTPPSVSISAPSNNNVIQSVSVVNFIANAFATGTTSTNAANTITSVEFFLNDSSVGLGAREQTTNLFRLAYDFSKFDFSNVVPDATTGRYALTLYAIAKDANGNQTLSVTVSISINPAQSAAPTVILQTFPGNPTTITQGTSFFMAALPSDSDGTITSLQLFANGTASGGAIANPGNLGTLVTFTPQVAGRYNLYVVATDDTGNTAVSSPAIVLNVTAINPPSTAITRPSDDATVTTVNTPVFLEGTASGSDITQIPSVQFVVTASTGARAALLNGQRIGTTTTYRAIWTPTAADTYTIATQASVSNVSANSAASRRVVVNNVIGIAPVVSSISFNPSQTTFTSASTANFSVTATDSDGSVAGVEFFLNRNSIGQATRDQLTNTWRITSNFAGLALNTSTELVAIARDSSGNTAVSPQTNITITGATSAPPTLSIVATPSTVAFSQAAQLTALASDPDGSVSSVQYFVNGSSVGTSFNPSSNYQVNWTSSTSGTFNVYALATDNTGNTAISTTLQVTVKRNNPIIDNDAFVLQTFQDIVNRSPNSSELTLYGSLISSGGMTRAGLINTLVETTATATTFNQTVNALAAYYVIMGQWPTTANYSTIFNLRGSLSNVCGNVISSADYVLRYPERTTPTTALLNNPASAIPAKTFLDRLWTNAGARPDNADVDLVRFMNNNTASTTIGRGYNVVGLNTAIAEFVTNTNANNVALFNSARAAALFFMLAKPQVLNDTTNALAGSMTVAAFATRVAALAPQVSATDVTAVADLAIKDILYGYRYVTITKHPQPLTVNARSGAIFTVEASGQPPLSYQWLLNGAPVAGATSSTLTVTNVDGTKTGTYSVAVSTPAGAATSDPAVLQLTTTPTRVANLSTRGVTNAGGQLLIGGFVVSGPANQTRQMLIRVVGPTLAGSGVAGALGDPRLEVYTAANQNVPILTNDNWTQQTGGAAAVTAIQQAATRVGAFPLPNNSLDAAILATLQPGLYTIQAKAPAGSTNAGVVLIEAYDATPNVTLTTPKPVNVSTRGPVGTAANIMIAGFVIDGAASRRVLIRGVGPTLARFNVPGVLADPQIELFDSAGKSLRKNDDWAAGDDAAQIAAASTAAGAFPLANGSKDSAMLLMLPPGAYTVQLSGVNNTTGVAIVEVYDVDP